MKRRCSLKNTKELNRPFLLPIFTGVSVMALLILTALGNALLMVLVALGLLIAGIVVFGREILRPGAWAGVLGIITASAIALLWLFWPR